MADWITRSELQAFMGQAIAADAQLDAIIPGVVARIEEFCGRTFLQDDYTEFICGNGSREICLRNRPVILDDLTVWQSDMGYWGQAQDVFGDDAELVLGVDYALAIDQPDGETSRSGILYRITGTWTRWPEYTAGQISAALGAPIGNIKVEYTGGFVTVPADVKQAAFILAASVRSKANLGEAVLSETLETYSYQLRPIVDAAFGGMPGDSLAALARYRNLPWG